jgi:hypothetical protein
MRNWKAIGLFALLLPALAVGGQEKPKPKVRKLSVHLSFSVEEYEPSKPSKAVLKCVVHNDSPLPLHAPVGYDGGYIRLQSGALSLAKRKREKEDVKLVWVEPGKQQVVFELPLDDVFLVAKETDPRWRWHWLRRPAPPFSPIHKGRTMEFVDEASFSVSLDLGGYTLTSERTTLKVKSDGSK